MRIIVTGTPGTGKSSIARALGKRLRHKVVNEKDFAVQRGIGKWDDKEQELVIPLAQFGQELKKFLQKEECMILEGHLLCELKLQADFVVLVAIDSAELEARLRARGYGEEKVQDNVFCESIGYCRKRVAANYRKEQVIEAQGGKTIKEAMQHIISEFSNRGVKV